MPDHAIDVTVKTSRRTTGMYTRTALNLKRKTNSIDLVDEDGKLIARLNAIFYKNEKGEHWSLDICNNVERKDQEVRVINWKEGNRASLEGPGNTTCVLLITKP